MKKVLSVLLICVVLMSTILTAPAYAVAVEIIGGSYVAYAILAAALAAAGYTIASTQLDEETFQAILDGVGAEDIKAMITATQVFTSVNGRVFFNWTSSQWFRFITWVNSYVATGELIIPSSSSIFVDTFDPVSIASYYETYIPTSNGIIGYYIGGGSVLTVQNSTNYRGARIMLTDGAYLQGQNNGTWISDFNRGVYMFGSPIINTIYGPKIIIGMGMKSNNNVAYNRDDIVKCAKWLEDTLNHVIVGGYNFTMSLVNGNIIATASNLTLQITGTLLFPDTYSSVMDWFTDVINTGSLVGDWSGIGEDVINPAGNGTEVGIDFYPDWRVGTGIDALPDSLEDGASIDIPLNPYIETDLGPDVIDPYVDFTPWDTTTVPPDDVIPDTRINPPADVTADPDTPWADDQTYPIDYPRDTTTDIPADPTWEEPDENSDPNQNSNRLKLGPLILSKFPFCLPWDLQHAIKTLVTPGEAPVFTVPIRNDRLGWDFSLTMDLSQANTLTAISRWFLSALWVVILILLTKHIIWG